MIIGIDPGTTSGVAILDSSGNVLNVYSKRYMSRGELISHILKFGNPLIVASDVSVIPRSVEKIATKLECITYSPPLPISFNEKRGITREFDSLVKNDHENDALVAAIKAWKNFRNMFSKVDETLKKFGKQELFREVVKSVITDESPNIEDSVRELLKSPKERGSKTRDEKEEFHGTMVRKLHEKLAETHNQIKLMERRTELLNNALSETRKKLAKLEKIRHNQKRTAAQDKSGGNIEDLKKLRKVERKGYYPIVEIDKIDFDAVRKIDDEIDLEDSVILTDDRRGLTLLNDYKIKCVIVSFEIDNDIIQKIEFPIINIGHELMETFEGIKAVKKHHIEREITSAKKLGLVGWLEKYKKRRE